MQDGAFTAHGGLTRRRSIRAALVGSAALLLVVGAPLADKASAQSEQPVSMNIRAQDLGTALTTFADQAGIRLLLPSGVVTGQTSPALSGSMTREEALSRLLAGTNLSHRFVSADTVTISERVAAAHHAPVEADGSLMLDMIRISSASAINPAEVPYETAAPTDYISGERIERFRGSNPADIFRGTAGVMSGEARNSGSALDVNIRGMQGMGRVAITVDGAENSLQVYQGYQGISNRTFVDPDLLGGVSITKGADAASFGMAGTVAMRTLDAADIVKPGNIFGLRLKGGFGSNTSSPPGAEGSINPSAGYSFPTFPWSAPVANSTGAGMDRPAFLDPTSGSGSAVAAMQTENVDLVAAYAHRRRGNYHAGTNGPHAEPVSMGPQRICSTDSYGLSSCRDWADYIDNAGIANYRAGEEVLNTQLETQSWLAKSTFRFDGGHSLQLGYTGFLSEAGDRMASALTDDRLQAFQIENTVGTELHSGTLRYRWNPQDNDLVDLKSNLWMSRLELRNPRRASTSPTPAQLGLPSDFRTGSDTTMWGADISNASAVETGLGGWDFDYGLSFRNEDTKPSAYTAVLEPEFTPRDGTRDEVAGWAKASWKPLDWLGINGGLRYQHFWSDDRGYSSNMDRRQWYVSDYSANRGGFSPSIGVTIEPYAGTQFYANYSNAMRLPSIMESTSSFGTHVNTDIAPERSSNWEVGVNVIDEGLIFAGDKGMIKLGYFNWTVSDYIARRYVSWAEPEENGRWGLKIENIHRAYFSGLEFSGRYETGGLTAELSANYYLDVEYCRTSSTCENSSLYGDYATNQVPPEYAVDLTLTQKLFDDTLTLGGMVSHVGPRSVAHGDEAGRGAAAFITLIDWEPYTLLDVFADYKINENFTLNARVENLTDTFYVDPLSLVLQPGPGRTFYASLTAKF